MDAPKADLLRQQVENLTMPNMSATTSELQTTLHIVCALMHVMRGRIRNIMHNFIRRPIMYSYMSDGWSSPVSEVKTELMGSHLVRREGKYRHEFVLERGLIRAEAGDGTAHLGYLLGPPRGLKNGRSAAHFLTSAVEFAGLLRAHGHEGPILNWYVFDGLFCDSLSELLVGRHELGGTLCRILRAQLF